MLNLRDQQTFGGVRNVTWQRSENALISIRIHQYASCYTFMHYELQYKHIFFLLIFHIGTLIIHLSRYKEVHRIQMTPTTSATCLTYFRQHRMYFQSPRMCFWQAGCVFDTPGCYCDSQDPKCWYNWSHLPRNVCLQLMLLYSSLSFHSCWNLYWTHKICFIVHTHVSFNLYLIYVPINACTIVSMCIWLRFYSI